MADGRLGCRPRDLRALRLGRRALVALLEGCLLRREVLLDREEEEQDSADGKGNGLYPDVAARDCRLRGGGLRRNAQRDVGGLVVANASKDSREDRVADGRGGNGDDCL